MTDAIFCSSLLADFAAQDNNESTNPEVEVGLHREHGLQLADGGDARAVAAAVAVVRPRHGHARECRFPLGLARHHLTHLEEQHKIIITISNDLLQATTGLHDDQ